MKLPLFFIFISLVHCNNEQNTSSDNTPATPPPLAEIPISHEITDTTPKGISTTPTPFEETSINRETTDTTTIDPQETARTAHCQLFDNLYQCIEQASTPEQFELLSK